MKNTPCHQSLNLSPRSAFTLVELLVVIAIIGVLVGLLLPAVQSAREAARRSSCINNAKQIGLGLHLYESAKKRFPPGVFYEIGKMEGTGSRLGWAVMILPYIEQETLYDAFARRTSNGFAFPYYSWTGSATIRGFLNTPLPAYMCPSDVMATGTGGNTTINSPGMAKLNYVGVAGSYGQEDGYSVTSPTRVVYRPCDEGGTPCPDGTNAPRRKGIFGGASKTKISEIADGTSKTLLLVERDGGVANGASQRRAAIWAGTYNQLWVQQHLAGTRNTNGWRINDESKYAPGSLHSGFGLTATFADGAVKFLSGNMDSVTWETLGGMNDGGADEAGNTARGDY